MNLWCLYQSTMYQWVLMWTETRRLRSAHISKHVYKKQGGKAKQTTLCVHCSIFPKRSVLSLSERTGSSSPSSVPVQIKKQDVLVLWLTDYPPEPSGRLSYQTMFIFINIIQLADHYCHPALRRIRNSNSKELNAVGALIKRQLSWRLSSEPDCCQPRVK